jgi:hypothetical protein
MSKPKPRARPAQGAKLPMTQAGETNIPFHPFAGIFPLMQGPEFETFVADIEAHGLREPITRYQGQILEGRNRYRACQRFASLGDKLGVSLKDKHKPHFEEFEGDDAAALAFVVSRNLHRRHLTAEDRRKALVAIVAAQPEKSDRAIAHEAGVADHKQVSRARKRGEATGAIAPVERRKGADGRVRRKPAKPSRARRWQEQDHREAWQAEWRAEGRSLKDYKAGVRDRNSEFWKWRRAKDDAAAALAAPTNEEAGRHNKTKGVAPTTVATAPGALERLQAEAAKVVARTTGPDAKLTRAEILTADRWWAVQLADNDIENARKLHALLVDDERRTAVTETLGKAIDAKAIDTGHPIPEALLDVMGEALGITDNDVDPTESADRLKNEFAASEATIVGVPK